MTKTKKQLGQSLIEAVFSVGIIILVTGGVMALMVTSLKSTTSGFDRKKAAELGQKVIESMLEERNSRIASFWDISSPFWLTNLNSGLTMAGYPGYSYSIGFTQVVSVGTSCTATPFNCATATVSVGWSGDPKAKVTFTRFFARQ